MEGCMKDASFGLFNRLVEFCSFEFRWTSKLKLEIDFKIESLKLFLEGTISGFVLIP